MSEHIGILDDMLEHMRTTVILPDELYRQVKERARAEDRTITSFLEQALRNELERRQAQQPPVYRVRPFTPPPGMRGTLPGVDLTDKDLIQDILDEDDFTVQQIRAHERSER